MSSPSSGSTEQYQNVSAGAFVGALGSGLAIFGAQVALFYLLKIYFPRIYRPRTYLVPEKNRTPPPPEGLFSWIRPVLFTPNSEFIRKCGLDAYFFLRYLRLLLKIFIPMACVILPILLPINATSGVSQAPGGNVTGLNTLAWSNINTKNHNRYWAHLVLAVAVIIYLGYIFFDELKAYIRLRQAYLTSPQHRLRASATTVLVTSIPPKWLTYEALDGLYDVFPGGIRNIWINRNYQELSDKVDLRNKLAKRLESAETNLIKNAKQKQMEDAAKEAKKKGKKMSKKEKEEEQIALDGAAEETANGKGMSAGNPHQIQTLRQFFHRGGASSGSQPGSKEASPERKGRIAKLNLGPVGDGLGKVGQGLGVVSGGINKLGRIIPGRHGSPEKGGKDATSDDATADEREREAPRAGDDFSENPQPPPKTSTSLSDTHHNSHQFGHRRNQSSNEQSASLRTNEVRSPNSFESEPKASPTMSPRSEMDPLDAVTQSHWKFWRKNVPAPSPIPHMKEEDEFPLNDTSPTTVNADQSALVDGKEDKNVKNQVQKSISTERSQSSESRKEVDTHTDKPSYPAACDAEVADNEEIDPVWKKYMKPGDRETTRLPLGGLTWMPFMPSWTFIGKKVDVIYHCRKEVARLNVEIEEDQKHPDKFPLMNSAFIQFNHQVAAHMACQSVSHHLPQQMAPRLIEISPDDILWDNMSMKWWERYIRTGAVSLVIAGMVIFWAIPVAFTGFVSQFSQLAKQNGFHWISKIPEAAASIIQGILPPALVSLLFVVVPVILKLLHNLQGLHTGNGVQIAVQRSYFAFLFVQLFLIVTVSSSALAIIQTLDSVSKNITSVPQVLAQNIPKAANYFFNYMIVQALSTSAGALAQVGVLFVWFILRPLVDSTPRQKWSRQLKLPRISWGKFFPVYTNLACIGTYSSHSCLLYAFNAFQLFQLTAILIGLIYSIIAPLVLVFNIITFSLFWVVYRYNTLYVNKFKIDTGGLLFPTAVNQLYTGVYVMELALIGLFFLVRDEQDNASGKSQGIIMIVVLFLTIAYQFLLNQAYSPLFRYLPITLEDEAVIQDEEFAKAQSEHLRLLHADDKDALTAVDSREGSEGHELQDLESPDSRNKTNKTLSPGSWNEESRSRSRARRSAQLDGQAADRESHSGSRWDGRARHQMVQDILHPRDAKARKEGVDVEAQVGKTDYNVLFGGRSDELEDLTPEERDKLVERAFRHRALRARRPVIWIPRDDLGISDDEIKRTKNLTDYVWISNDGAALNAKGNCIFKKPPPDFSDIDLIDL